MTDALILENIRKSQHYANSNIFKDAVEMLAKTKKGRERYVFANCCLDMR